jgi:hypothetical protein
MLLPRPARLPANAVLPSIIGQDKVAGQKDAMCASTHVSLHAGMTETRGDMKNPRRSAGFGSCGLISPVA